MLTFQQAIQQAKKYNKIHALLGNGFSISCRPDIFVYGKLFERADFGRLSSSARRTFDALKTQDFEKVIKALRDSSAVLNVYRGDDQGTIRQIISDADGLREVLVHTIASSHPEWPGSITDEEYASCRRFLAHFDNVYTLNYDLLLYWTVMHDDGETKINTDDGFRKPDGDYDSEYVVWEADTSRNQNIWYLHGALFTLAVTTTPRAWPRNRELAQKTKHVRAALGLHPQLIAEHEAEITIWDRHD